MSSRFRIEPAGLLIGAAIAAALLVAGCERERREYHAGPTQAPSPAPRVSTLYPGEPLADIENPIGKHYQNNAYHIGQGARLYRWFNCNGCHANGGGGMGPALMDDEWRYGGRIEQIHATILQGRPNGMPTWRGKMTDQQAWQLAAYVLSMSGNVRKDARPGRSDTLLGPPPPTQSPNLERKGGNKAAVEMPGQ